MTSYVYWVRGAEHAEYCELSIRSVRKVDPHARITVYTDEASASWKVDAAVARMPGGRPAMMAREEAKVIAACTADHGEELLFLDSDILLRERFPFDAHADLYLTYRDYTNVRDGEKIGDDVAKIMPYNGGVVGVRVGPAAIEALVWCKARMLKMIPDRQKWWGDQMALAELVGRSPPGTYDRMLRWSLEDRGTALRVHVLDGERWNYTPQAEDEDFTGRSILHCKGKGNRKAIMRRIAA